MLIERDPSNEPISLLLGVHAHQPVGNFPEVIDDAHQRCYRPFLQTLLRYPEFRFSAHFSGWLLGEMLERYPQDMEILATMVERGQVELFGAGDTEPVLAAIPSNDRVDQLLAMADRLERAFGVRPKGAWLTERVWEGGVVPALLAGGIRYVVVDDYHFLCTGLAQQRLDRHFATEDDGVALDVFPISEALRYRLPFAPAGEAVRGIAEMAAAGQSGAIYFDDIEKFGIWPETYDWVYGKRWLEQFIEGVLASPAIRTSTFDDFHARVPRGGVVYLPSTSYIEMNEWTLPARAALQFHELAQRERDAGRFDTTKAFVRGGIWRNFLSRYPESNWMHKRMLGLSRRFARLPSAHPQGAAMRAMLHRAQANDAYWHGLFGGLYLPHLRRSVWHELIALEAALDAAGVPRDPDSADVDLDGRTEWFLRGTTVQAAVRDDGNACVFEFAAYALAHNFADTLARRREAYHRKIGEAPSARAEDDGIASAHDRVDFRHEISASDLVFDERPRAIAVDRLRLPDGTELGLGAWSARARVEGGQAIEFEHAAAGGSLVKRIAVDGARLKISWRCRGLRGTVLRTRVDLAMPSCDGVAGRYVLADGSIPGGFGQPLALESAAALALEDGVLGGSLALACAPAARIDCAPLHTVSLSEAGFEKIMQAASLELSFAVDADDASFGFELEARD